MNIIDNILGIQNTDLLTLFSIGYDLIISQKQGFIPVNAKKNIRKVLFILHFEPSQNDRADEWAHICPKDNMVWLVYSIKNNENRLKK